MRELNLVELKSVSGGWDNTENPLDGPFTDSRGLTIPGVGGFDSSDQTGPPVTGGVETSGGSNGLDSWSADVSADTDGDGDFDLNLNTNSDGDWSADYTFDNGVTVGVSTTTEGGPNTPGNSGTFDTVTVRF